MASIKTGNTSQSIIIAGSVKNSDVRNKASGGDDLFSQLCAALDQVEDGTERQQLQELVVEMEAQSGKPGFIKKYGEFMQMAANHVTIITPFLTTLAAKIHT